MNYLNPKNARMFFLWLLLMCSAAFAEAFTAGKRKEQKTSEKHTTVLYGQASFYATKFHGRRTASGKIFNHSAYTAACNTLPLGTWVKVTNLRNGKTVIVQTNDRLHAKTSRLIDLTRAAAQKLDFIKAGLTRVKIEVLKEKNDK